MAPICYPLSDIRTVLAQKWKWATLRACNEIVRSNVYPPEPMFCAN